jgi:hypothetical protein
MSEQMRRKRNGVVGDLALDVAVCVLILIGFVHGRHGRYYGIPPLYWRAIVVSVIVIGVVDVVRAIRLSDELDRDRGENT